MYECNVRSGMAWYGTVRYGTARHGTARYGTARYGVACMYVCASLCVRMPIGGPYQGPMAWITESFSATVPKIKHYSNSLVDQNDDLPPRNLAGVAETKRDLT